RSSATYVRRTQYFICLLVVTLSRYSYPTRRSSDLAFRLTFHSAGNIAIRTNRQSRRRSRLPGNRRLTAERPNTLNPRQCEISGLDPIAFDLNHYGAMRFGPAAAAGAGFGYSVSSLAASTGTPGRSVEVRMTCTVSTRATWGLPVRRRVSSFSWEVLRATSFSTKSWGPRAMWHSRTSGQVATIFSKLSSTASLWLS